jgi:hypothetical protein
MVGVNVFCDYGSCVAQDGFCRSNFCQTEIENFGVSTAGNKYICGFDVAVDDALCVSGVQSVSYLSLANC